MRRLTPILTTFLLVLLLLVVYVLSYAPVVRYCVDPGASAHGIYRPVEWLIDETPVREPLLVWAQPWGVRSQLEMDSLIRLILRTVEPG